MLVRIKMLLTKKCKYYIVFIPRFRRKVIYNKLRKDLQKIIKQLCQWKRVEIIEGRMVPEHVHLFKGLLK